ncbi:hypothetical protein SDC9_118573 [bioreactor metagenome]|uniref:Uncharacterized protein n=1 Tax=bioreactor metagenome TaxID=1076179 RepID=A0A645C240_9ZZZZ
MFSRSTQNIDNFAFWIFGIGIPFQHSYHHFVSITGIKHFSFWNKNIGIEVLFVAYHETKIFVLDELKSSHKFLAAPFYDF